MPLGTCLNDLKSSDPPVWGARHSLLSTVILPAQAPLPSLPSQKPTWRKAAALAGAWELQQLARRLDELASA